MTTRKKSAAAKPVHAPTKAGVAEKRGKCAAWLCGLCRGGPECACIPPARTKRGT